MINDIKITWENPTFMIQRSRLQTFFRTLNSLWKRKRSIIHAQRDRETVYFFLHSTPLNFNAKKKCFALFLKTL